MHTPHPHATPPSKRARPQRKGHMRLWLWLFKALGTMDFDPELITVRLCALCVFWPEHPHVGAGVLCQLLHRCPSRCAPQVRTSACCPAPRPLPNTHTHIPQHQTHTYHRTHKYATQANTQHTQHAQITPAGGSRTIVHMTANFAFFPRRTWRLPPTLLLPSRINFAGELRCCVRGDLQSGKVGVVACLQLCVRCALCAGPANSGL